MPSYDFICPKCGYETIHIIEYEKRDTEMFTCPDCDEDEEILVRRTTCHGIKPEQSFHTPTQKGMMKDILEYHKVRREGWRKEAKESIDEKIKRNNEVVKLKYTKQ